MKAAFITASEWPELCEDDQLAAAHLRAQGHDIVPVVWDRTSAAALNAFDAVVIRNPWDWFNRRLEFKSFLERLGDVGVPLFNPHSMLLEYFEKTYLRTLEARGVPIVPTRWLTRDALDTLPGMLRESGWARAVIKPTVSANSYDTHLFSAAEAKRVMALLRNSADHDQYMVQPYLDEIEHDGEWSLIFFGGHFSHCVRKYPKLGDFRVQTEHGGRSEASVPSAALIAQATKAVERGVPASLYARVDGVVRESQLLLMELEVVEPELFFRADTGAAERFAAALLAAVGGER